MTSGIPLRKLRNADLMAPIESGAQFVFGDFLERFKAVVQVVTIQASSLRLHGPYWSGLCFLNSKTAPFYNLLPLWLHTGVLEFAQLLS